MSLEEFLEFAVKTLGAAAAGVGAWFGGSWMQRRKTDAEAARIGAETTGSLSKLGPEVAAQVQQVYERMVAELQRENQRLTTQLTEQIAMLRAELTETRTLLVETRHALEAKGREHDEMVQKLRHAAASAKDMAKTLKHYEEQMRKHGLDFEI